jgi:hypothetical protein
MLSTHCRATAVVLSLAFGAATACSSAPVSPSPSAPGVLSPEIRVALEAAIADEYRSETIYQGVINDLGQVLPFVNILTAEQRHSEAIANVMTTYGLAVPSNPWNVASVPHLATLSQACTTGAGSERENIAIYDRFLQLDLPADVRRVFENNRAASLQSHLPAFERCAVP